MSKKRTRDKSPKEFTLDFTGTMVVIVELKEGGTMRFDTTDDRETVTDVLRVLVKFDTDDTVPLEIKVQSELEVGVLGGLIQQAKAT